MKKLYLFILLLAGSQLAMAQSDGKPPKPSELTYAVPVTEVKIAPNPGKDYIWVSIPLPASGTSDIIVYDMLGRRVHAYRTNTEETMLNVSQWHEGVYLFSANTKDGMVTRRFIKAD